MSFAFQAQGSLPNCALMIAASGKSFRIKVMYSVSNQINIQHGDARLSFDGDPASSLLDQLLANKAPVSYSCRRGDCGQCGVKLLEGEAAALDKGRPLWQMGSLLTCNAVACSPLSLRIPYIPELEGIRVLRSPAKVQGLELLGSDVMQLTLRLPPANRIAFLPGQFVRLTNSEGTLRSYSLSAGPQPDGMLRMHIRRVEKGAFSDWLFARAVIGDLLQLEGPQGHFFQRENRSVDRSVFLATGTGIAPVYAILAAASEKQRAALGEVWVYWGNRFRKDAYLAEQLADLSLQRGMRLTLVFSREEDTGHVQDHMRRDHAALDGAQVFACGNPAMIEGARTQALAAGLGEDFFYSDSFTAS
ncbi:hypothetical protein D0B54_15030 [Solimonas sp. K1W22B-7]|uniref:FAD-binding oxidoreductase n=1 Tax=Solimonas sp. K1W22B-7 TaxID=2303331 RepID=UPI000E33418A|nr:FAD-binding oxidoreductase [Solimonas sp. K1W22B-7]AXQ29910.1 hypothetical protein D0B54_15030 [Solimonas sp. K1W22B-7]